MTNVPSLTLTPAGFVAVPEQDIFDGCLADIQSAFGGDLSEGLNTPQGQLATSMAAIVGDNNATFLDLMAGVDPATSSGRMQDGIARIYFIERNPAEPTVVTATCRGKTGTTIPVNAKAADQAGRLYLCTQAGTIDGSGAINLTFACATTGPIACPVGYLSQIYQAIPGWDSITNASAGVEGSDVETPQEFEYRRAQSVALNANSTTAAVRAAVLAVPGVLDAFAMENPLDTQSGAQFSARINGTVMSVLANDGILNVGDMVLGLQPGTVISSFITGTGGPGDYGLSIDQPDHVGTDTYLLQSSPGGVIMGPHSIFVSAYGGNAQSIGAAILSKKAPGCNYNGNTTVTVQDTSALFTAPYPSYQVKFTTPTPTPVKFAIRMQNNGRVPSTAVAQIQAAVEAAFNGQDGGERARIAMPIFAARFYAGIVALGPWAQIFSIKLGISAATEDTVQMQADQVPTVSATDIAVTFA